MLPDSALCIDCRVGTIMEFKLIHTKICNKVAKFEDFFLYFIK